MTQADDALKAVEALTDIVRDLASESPRHVRHIEALNALRMGCEALRLGFRRSEFAREILDRPLPAPPSLTAHSPGASPL
jgi:hypothetical protein